MICFRITRFCNARCGFCLAPPDGTGHPSAAILKSRIDWLLAQGVKTIHFCGGEPTIHQDLPELIDHVAKHGGKSKLTTNGIRLVEELLPVLRRAKTGVKVSLHGDQAHHDQMVGRAAYFDTTATIKRLLATGVATSVQTTIVAGRLDVVGWIVEFCRQIGVRRVSFLPFIPRGSGNHRRTQYELLPTERCQLKQLIKEKRKRWSGRIDIRFLDFTARPFHVVEPDGRIMLEGAAEARDIVLYQIPQTAEEVFDSGFSGEGPDATRTGRWDADPTI